MITIKRISVGAAFKVSAVFSGLMSAVTAFFYIGFFVLLSNSFTSSYAGVVTPTGTSTTDFGDVSGALLVVLCLCGVLFYAIIGGIFGAIGAVIYNFVARTVGGIELEVTGLGDVAYDDPFSPSARKRKTIDIPDRDF
ncbi:MAG: DUF3566 domain-containing protein [Aggregatilineales bacterium]